MYGLQDIESELPRTAFRRFDRTKLRDRDAVMGFFNEIPREIMRRHGVPGVGDYGFCSTIMLLQAEKSGAVSWEQLSELIARRVNYPAIFEHVCGSIDSALECYSQAGDTYEGFDLDFYLISLRCVPTSVFTRLIAALADALRGVRGRDFIRPDESLLGRSPVYWMNLENFSFSPARSDRASEYVGHVCRREDFTVEAGEIASLLQPGTYVWMDPGHQGLRFGRDHEPGGSDDSITALLEDEALCRRLKEFFAKWCLGGCQRKQGDEKLVVFIPRVSVEVAPSNMGINVFIPRFYAFSHIKNCADADFAVLKMAMEMIHEPMKDPRASKEDQDAEARNIRRKLEDEGMEPGKAWDETRRRMDWAESTMEKRIGLRPEGRTKPRRRTAGKPSAGLEEHRIVHPGGED